MQEKKVLCEKERALLAPSSSTWVMQVIHGMLKSQ
jgi:hypothetical protein